MNPVVARELKERMRGLRAFLAIGAFLALLTLTVWAVFKNNDSQNVYSFNLERQTRLGRDVFEWLLAVMMILLLFLVPALTAGTISGERERQTLATLQLTMLRPRAIIWGKVQAAVVYLLLMIVAALPLFAVAYQLGGVSLMQALRGVAVLLVMGVLIATMVASISAFAKRVQTATLMAYGFTALLSLGSIIAFAVAGIVDSSQGTDDRNPPAALLIPNPVVFVADATSGQNVAIGNSPLRLIRQQVVRAYNSNDGWGARSAKLDKLIRDGNVVAPGGQIFPNGGFGFVAADNQRRGFPAWALSLGSMAALAAALFTLACRRLRTPAETER